MSGVSTVIGVKAPHRIGVQNAQQDNSRRALDDEPKIGMTNKTIPATTKPAAGPQGSPAPSMACALDRTASLSGAATWSSARPAWRPRQHARRGRSAQLVQSQVRGRTAGSRGDAPEYMTEIGLAANSFRRAFSARTAGALQFADTVKNPNYVTVDASPRSPRPRLWGGRPGICARCVQEHRREEQLDFKFKT